MSENLSYLGGRKGLNENLFEKLGIAAEEHGTPDEMILEKLRQDFLVGKSSVYGAVSFYDFLRPENKGKKVYVCNGSACLTAGTQNNVLNEIKKQFKDDEIGEMCCLGRCHENAAFNFSGNNYSGKDIDDLKSIKENKVTTKEHYHVSCSGEPILTEDINDVLNYYKDLSVILTQAPESILKELELAGIRGRGGAGFSMAFKLKACKDAASKTKFIVCNADEGDPGAYSDRYILEQQPHKLLKGMILAGYMTGAQFGVVYIRGEYPESVNIINDAIAFLSANKLCGHNILGTGFNFEFKVIKAQGAYICGEETALLSSIEGQRPEVRVRPPYPAQVGLFNQPTVVNNVETLANLPYILKHGGKKFASIGTNKSTGTKLISLDSFFNRPGIYEVDMGTPLEKVINELGLGFKKPVKALHIGGPLGGLVPLSKIKNLNIDYDSFSSEGFLLGHGSIICIPEDFPIIKYLEHLFKFTAHESCGKCFPCRIGSTRGFEMLERAVNGSDKVDRALLDDLLETLRIGSLCALGGGLPLPVNNALFYFKEELSVYFK